MYGVHATTSGGGTWIFSNHQATIEASLHFTHPSPGVRQQQASAQVGVLAVLSPSEHGCRTHGLHSL